MADRDDIVKFLRERTGKKEAKQSREDIVKFLRSQRGRAEEPLGPPAPEEQPTDITGTIRTALTTPVPIPGTQGVTPASVIEPLVGVAEIFPEVVRRKVRAGAELLREGKEAVKEKRTVSFDKVLDFIKPETDALALPFQEGATLGPLVTEDVPEDGFEFLPEILEEEGVPELGTVNLPVIGEVSGRGLLGFAIELGLPSAPGLGVIKNVKKADIETAARLLEKGQDITKAEAKFVKETVQKVDEGIEEATRRTGKIFDAEESSRVPELGVQEKQQFEQFIGRELSDEEFIAAKQEIEDVTNPQNLPDVEPQALEETPQLTSARAADIKRDREAIGLSEINSPDRRAWQDALNTAKQQELDLRAPRLISEINQTPRPLTDQETAGIVLHTARLKKDHRELTNTISNVTDEVDLKIKSGEIQRIEEEFDKATRALRISGTEKGRALAAQKLTINEDFDLVSILNRAKVASEKPLTQKQRANFEGLIKKLEARDQKITELERQINELTAGDIIKQPKKFRTQKQDFNQLVSRARKLLEEGCEIA